MVGTALPALLLASIAILPGARVKVWVGPPLFASVVLIMVLAAPVGVIGVKPKKLPLIPFAPFVPTIFAPIKFRLPKL